MNRPPDKSPAAKKRAGCIHNEELTTEYVLLELGNYFCVSQGNVIARNIFHGVQCVGIHEAARHYLSVEDNLIDEDPREMWFVLRCC